MHSLSQEEMRERKFCCVMAYYGSGLYPLPKNCQGWMLWAGGILSTVPQHPLQPPCAFNKNVTFAAIHTWHTSKATKHFEVWRSHIHQLPIKIRGCCLGNLSEWLSIGSHFAVRKENADALFLHKYDPIHHQSYHLFVNHLVGVAFQFASCRYN